MRGQTAQHQGGYGMGSSVRATQCRGLNARKSRRTELLIQDRKQRPYPQREPRQQIRYLKDILFVENANLVG